MQVKTEVQTGLRVWDGPGSLRSSLAKSKWFTAAYDEGKHFLENRTIIIRLRGHGVVMLAKNPQEVIRAIKEDMEFTRPAKLMV